MSDAEFRDNRPFRIKAGEIKARVIRNREGTTTVFYDPPIVFEKDETWVSFSDDGRVGIYDDDGNLIQTVASSGSERGVHA